MIPAQYARSLFPKILMSMLGAFFFLFFYGDPEYLVTLDISVPSYFTLIGTEWDAALSLFVII